MRSQTRDNSKNKINFSPEMKAGLFNILEQTESTNNYAMQQVHAGIAVHGSAWFTRFQSKGKGQRGKQWMSKPDESILLSVCVQPPLQFSPQKFYFNALVALTCANFLEDITNESVQLKWPNDLYWRDRKAGGILIENILQGSNWKWAVIGMGLNVNQENFDGLDKAAVSVYQLTGKKQDPQVLAQQLHEELCLAFKKNHNNHEILKAYNEKLYKLNEKVLFKKGDNSFEAIVRGVNEDGELMTEPVQNFRFGEIEWIM